jgi:AraC-like DNA-binding protein
LRAILQELVYDTVPEGAVWPFDRRYIRPPHFHGQIELLLIRSGCATVHLGARAHAVRAGQLCWILPGIPHVMSGFSPDFDMWVVELDAASVDACWRSAASGGGRRPGTGDGCGGDAADDDAFTPFGWASPLCDRLAGRAIVHLDGEISRRLSDLAAAVWQASVPRRVREDLLAICRLALEATLAATQRDHQPSLADLASCVLLASPTMDRPALAAELGVSQGFLSRCFSRELGVTFVEHRARARVAHFLGLAQSGRCGLLDAALAAGFGSYSQLFRVFTRASGSSPRDYLSGGRHRRQLLVAGDREHPNAAPMRRLPAWQRHRARLDTRVP